MAIVEGVNRKTIVRKFLFLALQARREHTRRLNAGELKSERFQFDEMESFEHTRLKPLSLPLAVTAQGKIVDVKVSSMPYRGRLAELARRKYGYRPDKRREGASEVFQSIAKAAVPNSKILTDSKPAYRNWIRYSLPNLTHQPVEPKPQPNPARRANLDDPLFQLNHMAAKIRHDLSRMARKVWTTTKKPDRLQAHLDLYIAFNNNYRLAI